MPDRVLITGGAGYIGSVLTEHLLNQGHKVTCLDNLSMSQKTPALFVHHRNYAFVYGDSRDKETIEALVKKNDVIVPLAAIVGMPACNIKSLEANTINYEAVVMINNVRSHSQRLIYPTTNSGYGAKSGEVFCTEETPLEPISYYGETKTRAENELLDSGKPVISLRLATVFGFSPRMRRDLLVNDFVYKAVTDNYLVIYEPHFKRNFIHIRDIARCFEYCMDNFDKMKGIEKPVYNVGLEDANLSKLELAEKIKSFLPKFEIVVKDIGEDPDKRNYIVSNKKLLAAGFKPTYSLDYGIQELIRGYSILIRNDPLKNI